jgi:hypothetical protein
MAAGPAPLDSEDSDPRRNQKLVLSVPRRPRRTGRNKSVARAVAVEASCFASAYEYSNASAAAVVAAAAMLLVVARMDTRPRPSRGSAAIACDGGAVCATSPPTSCTPPRTRCVDCDWETCEEDGRVFAGGDPSPASPLDIMANECGWGEEGMCVVPSSRGVRAVGDCAH